MRRPPAFAGALRLGTREQTAMQRQEVTTLNQALTSRGFGKRYVRYLVLVVLAATMVTSYGRVFSRRRMGSGAAALAETLGWSTAYRTATSVNGVDGTLEVLACPDDIDSALAQLRTFYGEREVLLGGGRQMAWGSVLLPDRVVCLLLTVVDEAKGCLVFHMEKPRKKRKRTPGGPHPHRLTAVPHYPGGEPLYHMRDKQTDMEIEVSSVAGHPRLVARYFESRMVEDGWTRAVAPARGGAPRNMMMFLRGRDICCVSVGASADTGAAVITRLLKRPGVRMRASNSNIE